MESEPRMVHLTRKINTSIFFISQLHLGSTGFGYDFKSVSTSEQA